MLSFYKILTITHKQTKLQDIGQYVISHQSEAELQERLQVLKSEFGWSELYYLATCNRVLLFFCDEKQCDDSQKQRIFQSINPSLSPKAINKQVKYFEGEDALEHIFEVAASINSLVIGEREILRQLRQAYTQCLGWGLTNDNLRLAVKGAVVAAKEVYAQTRIGEKPISVVSLAIQKLLATNLPKDARILMIGAGQTNLLVTKFLKKHQYTNITVFNRSLSRAKVLADKTQGAAFELSDLPDYQGGFDGMIVCTGATQAIIDVDIYQKLLQGETDQKLVIDLAIPNNVSQKIVEQFNVNYIEIEDLRSLAKSNLAFRKKEVTKAKDLLYHHLLEFPVLYQKRQIERAFQSIPTEIKAIKAHAIEKVFQKELQHLDENTLELMQRMMTYMEKKCIGIPMKAAKEAVL